MSINSVYKFYIQFNSRCNVPFLGSKTLFKMTRHKLDVSVFEEKIESGMTQNTNNAKHRLLIRLFSPPIQSDSGLNGILVDF